MMINKPVIFTHYSGKKMVVPSDRISKIYEESFRDIDCVSVLYLRNQDENREVLLSGTIEENYKIWLSALLD